MRGGTNWRSIIQAPEGHWAFSFLEVTDYDGTWVNVGNLAIGARNVDFLNSYDLEDDIDRNTLSFSATLRGSVGVYSLMPFRTDSPLNVDASSSYQPLLDLHRQWRMWVCFTPRGTFPAGPEDYRERARGVVDRIDLSMARDEIRIQGRGPEADFIDDLVVCDEVTPKVYAAGPVATVLQAMLDDRYGVATYTLIVDGSAPSTFIDEITYTEPFSFWKVFSDVAAVGTGIVRFLYDASDNLAIHLFTPDRSATVPQWSVDADEYGDIDNGLDLSTVANYIVARFVNASGAIETVTSPTVDPAITPTASTARYGIKSAVITLAQNIGLSDATRVQAMIDAIRADRELPILGQVIKGTGLWFGELWDYVATPANGVLYDEDQAGGVVAWHESGRNGVIDNTYTLAGKPKGRYATWNELDAGPAALPDTTPVVTNLTASWRETLISSSRAQGVFAAATVNQYAQSVEFELSASLDFAVIIATNAIDAVAGTAEYGWVGLGTVTPGTDYYVRATPYSGALSGGSPTGTAGEMVVANTHSLPAPTATATIEPDLSDPTKLQFNLISVPGAALPGPVAGAAVAGARVEFFGYASAEEEFPAIALAVTEHTTRLRRPALLSGMGTGRLVGYVTQETTGDERLHVGSTTPGGSSFTDITAEGLPLKIPGPVRSNWFAIDGLMAADVDLRIVSAGGDGTQTARLSALALECSPTTYSGGETPEPGGGGGGGCGVVLATAYDDNFDCGSVIDQTGARFTGANAWTEFGVDVNFTGGVQSGGQLLMTVSSAGAIWSPRGSYQALPGGDWTFETECGLPTSAFCSAVGLRLTETATGKELACHFLETFGLYVACSDTPQPDPGNRGYTAIASLAGKIEVASISGNLRMRYDIGAGWVTLVASLPQTTPFTTAPDTIAVFHAPRRTGGADTAYHNYFYRTA